LIRAFRSGSRRSLSANLSNFMNVSLTGGIQMAAKKKPSGQKYSKKARQEVRTEMHHLHSGKHSKRHPITSRKQAIAIGLSKARKKGAKVPRKKASSSSRKAA
jgi:Family of unknown function (DUF6496)